MDTSFVCDTVKDNKYIPRIDYHTIPNLPRRPGIWGHMPRTEFDENCGRPKQGLGGYRMDVGRTPGGERSWAGKVHSIDVTGYRPLDLEAEDPTPIDSTRNGPRPHYWSLHDPRTDDFANDLLTHRADRNFCKKSQTLHEKE